jgi:transcriptional regulator with XRE-family HTH domain
MSTKTKRGLNNIYKMRRNRSLLQKQLAVLLGLRFKHQISRYEAGQTLPPLEAALLIEIALGVRLPELYPDLYRDLQVLVLKRADGLPPEVRRGIHGRLLGKDLREHT